VRRRGGEGSEEEVEACEQAEACEAGVEGGAEAELRQRKMARIHMSCKYTHTLLLLPRAELMADRRAGGGFGMSECMNE
jgi:hypothetical protein